MKVAAKSADASPEASPKTSRIYGLRRSARCRRSTRHYVRGQFDGYLDVDGVARDSPPRRTPPSAPRSTTGAGRASPSSSVGKCLGHADRAAASSSSTRTSSASPSSNNDPAQPARSSSSTRRPGVGSSSTPTRRRPRRPADPVRRRVRRGGRRGRPRTRCCSTPRCDDRRDALPPPGPDRGDLADHAAAARRAASRARLPAGQLGPEGPDALVADHGGWHSPWVA